MKISSFSLLIRYSVYEVTLHVPILFCNHPASVLTDKSKPEETAKCEFLIVHRLVLQGHTFDCSHVFCQLAGEGDVALFFSSCSVIVNHVFLILKLHSLKNATHKASGRCTIIPKEIPLSIFFRHMVQSFLI